MIDDTAAAAAEQPLPAWTVAVIDDDPAVHEGTRFALYDYNLNGQGIEILSAYSAEEGRELMRRTPSIAVILLGPEKKGAAFGQEPQEPERGGKTAL